MVTLKSQKGDVSSICECELKMKWTNSQYILLVQSKKRVVFDWRQTERLMSRSLCSDMFFFVSVIWPFSNDNLMHTWLWSYILNVEMPFEFQSRSAFFILWFENFFSYKRKHILVPGEPPHFKYRKNVFLFGTTILWLGLERWRKDGGSSFQN